MKYTIKQITIYLENRPGKLSEISDILGKDAVNIRAISVSDTANLSTIRLLVDHPDKAVNVLKSHGYNLSESEVLAVEAPDHPGGLNAILRPFRDAGINVLYLYPFIGRAGNNAIMILGVDNTDKAVKVLKQNWVRLFDKEIYSL